MKIKISKKRNTVFLKIRIEKVNEIVKNKFDRTIKILKERKTVSFFK